MAFVFSNVFANILSNHILDSINGTHIMHSRIKNLAKDMSIQKLDSIFTNLKNPAHNLELDVYILSKKVKNEEMIKVNQYLTKKLKIPKN